MIVSFSFCNTEVAKKSAKKSFNSAQDGSVVLMSSCMSWSKQIISAMNRRRRKNSMLLSSLIACSHSLWVPEWSFVPCVQLARKVSIKQDESLIIHFTVSFLFQSHSSHRPAIIAGGDSISRTHSRVTFTGLPHTTYLPRGAHIYQRPPHN